MNLTRFASKCAPRGACRAGGINLVGIIRILIQLIRAQTTERRATWTWTTQIVATSAMLAMGVNAAVAQQMMPPNSGASTPSGFGNTPRAQPQAQSLAPAYAPSPSMPIPPLAAPTSIGGNVPPQQQASLSLIARFGHESTITAGLIWRIFPAHPEAAGAFRAIKEERNPTPVLSLPAGDYIVHVSCGLVNVAKSIHLNDREAAREVFDLPAGGIKLEGRVGDVKIPPTTISFDIFQGSQFERQSPRPPLVQGVLTGDVVIVPEGNYYIVSNYGDTNAVVRSDIRVQTGKLTEVAVSHHAALITLKLVGERGGDAIANTSWSVITPGGDLIKESTGVFPRLVLAEGDYRAIAHNEGRTYEREFKVVTGVDGEVEVLAR